MRQCNTSLLNRMLILMVIARAMYFIPTVFFEYFEQLSR